tara:strand:- start:3838 stop:4119 length:282 start_codon:yes stop_codon:yes gene_type:complete
MIKIAIQLLNPAKNALRDSPTEYKFLLSVLLASMWCIAFGIFTAELLMIGYNIIGHIALILCVFVTWGVFKMAKKPNVPSTKNKVVWDLTKES